MAGFPELLWMDSHPGAWTLLALALYGLIALLLDTASVLRRAGRDQGHGSMSILVLIHNQEHQVEGVVNYLASRIWRGAPEAGRLELLLVDLESTDDTPLILQRLARRYEHVRLVTLPRYQIQNACEAALFLCRSPVTLLVDLRHNINAEGILRATAAWWK